MTEDVKDEAAVEQEQAVEQVAEDVAGEAAQAATAVAAHIDSVLIKRVLEAAILAADGPLDRDAMLLLFDEAERPDRAALDQILQELADSYADRGIELKEVASGFRFQVRREMGPWVSRLWQEKAPRYSRSEEHTSELQSRPHLVCRLLLEKKKKKDTRQPTPRPTHRDYLCNTA